MERKGTLAGGLALFLSLASACDDAKTMPPPGSETVGCDGSKLIEARTDPAARGPWPVGARTVRIGTLTAEVWYPATPGSERGVEAARYDIRQALPASEAAKIPDSDNPWQTCDCFRELPVDDSHGPYPVVVFVHGTASFRHQSLSIVTHWASRGFVVVAADHPGLFLADLLSMACGGSPPAQNLDGDISAVLAALQAPADDLAFLAGHISTTRIGLAGHSAGAGAAAAAASKPGVRAVISMAGAQSSVGTELTSMFLGGMDDTIALWNRVLNAWTGSPARKYLVGIDKAKHLAFSDLCSTKNAEGQDLLAIANEHGVCGAQLAGFLFDCEPGQLDAMRGWQIVNAASTAVLEATLQCKAPRALSELPGTFSEVVQYREEL